MTKLKVTCANKTVLAKLDCLGKDHSLGLEKAKERITKDSFLQNEKQHELKTLKVDHATHVACTDSCRERISTAEQELKDIMKSCHPGFIVAFDNIDIELHRKNMTMLAQNRTHHWVNHKMITNRVSGNTLPAEGPQAELADIPNIKFLPSIEDHEQQRLNYATLVSRVLVEYFDAFKPLESVCLQHIPHKYSGQMSEKSQKVCSKNSLYIEVTEL